MKYFFSLLFVIALTINVFSQAALRDTTNATEVNNKIDGKNTEVYLNSTEDTLFLGGLKSYFIYDSEGVLLNAGEGESVDISSLQVGVFTIETFTDGEKEVLKFEKEVETFSESKKEVRKFKKEGLKENLETISLNKNIFHWTIYNAGLAGGASLSYERIFNQLDGDITISTFGRIAVGKANNFASSDVTFSIVQIGFLTGKKRHHLECGAGFRANFTNKSGHPFVGNIGWRMQKPEKHFVLKMGVGVPELLYLGVGLSF